MEWIAVEYEEHDWSGRFDPTVTVTHWRKHGENSNGHTIRLRIGEARDLMRHLGYIFDKLDERQDNQ